MTVPRTHGLAVIALVLTLMTALSAQQRDTTTTARPTDEVATARISGIVVTDETPARPVRRAIVTLAGGGLLLNRNAVTDDEGRFDLAGLPAGRYSLSAARASFITLPSRRDATRTSRHAAVSRCRSADGRRASAPPARRRRHRHGFATHRENRSRASTSVSTSAIRPAVRSPWPGLTTRACTASSACRREATSSRPDPRQSAAARSRSPPMPRWTRPCATCSNVVEAEPRQPADRRRSRRRYPRAGTCCRCPATRHDPSVAHLRFRARVPPERAHGRRCGCSDGGGGRGAQGHRHCAAAACDLNGRGPASPHPRLNR